MAHGHFVSPVGRRRDAEHLGSQEAVQDGPVGRRRGVVSLVHDDSAERVDGPAFEPAALEGLDGPDDDGSAAKHLVDAGNVLAGLDLTPQAAKLDALLELLDQLQAVREHEGPAPAGGAPAPEHLGDARGLPCARGGHQKSSVVFLPGLSYGAELSDLVGPEGPGRVTTHRTTTTLVRSRRTCHAPTSRDEAGPAGC